MRYGHAVGIARHPRHCARAVPVPALADLSLPRHGVSRVSWFSVGQPADRDRLARHLPCANATLAASGQGNPARATRVVAAALAAVPAHVRVWLREITQRRSDLA